MTLEDSIATITIAKLVDNSGGIYYSRGRGLVSLDIRNTRNFLTVMDTLPVSKVAPILNTNTNPLTNILSKVNTYRSALPSIPYIFDQLLTYNGSGKLLSHHDTITFDIPQPETLTLKNIGPGFTTTPEAPLVATFYDATNTFLAKNSNVNTLSDGITTMLFPKGASTARLSINGVISPFTSLASLLEWEATLVGGKVVALDWENDVYTILVHAISPVSGESAYVEMIDADIRDLPAGFRIAKAHGPGAKAIAHNLRIHGHTVLPKRGDVEINGGTTIEHHLVTDGENLLGGQEASEVRAVRGHSARYTVENDITVVVMRGQGNVVTLPPIIPTNAQSRHGTKLVIKNADSGVVTVEAVDKSPIDGKAAIALAARSSVTLLATSEEVGNAAAVTASPVPASPPINREWHIVSKVASDISPIYPFDYITQGLTYVYTATFTQSFPSVFMDPNQVLLMTITGAGGGGFAETSSFVLGNAPVGGGGGGGAAIQFSLDSDILIASGYNTLTATKIGVAGPNTSDTGQDGTPTVLTISGGGQPIELTAYGGGGGGFSYLSFSNGGGGGGAGLGGTGQNGRSGGQGGDGGILNLSGGNGGSATGAINAPAVSQASITTPSTLFPQTLFNLLYAPTSAQILFTPGSGGSGYLPPGPAAGGAIGLINGNVIPPNSVNGGAAGGQSLGQYPVGPQGMGATSSQTVAGPAGFGGGGIYVNGFNNVPAGGGSIVVQAFKKS